MIRNLLRTLSFVLAILFAGQVLVVVPQHHFHEVEQAAQGSGHEKAPEDCRCDFCLAYSAVDTGSVSEPPVLVLHETIFAVVAAYSSFEYSHPYFFALGRGPPALSAA